VFEKAGSIHFVLASTRFNPSNFWNGRLTSHYTYSTSGSIAGEIAIDVHYYEDGNVRLQTAHTVDASVSASAGPGEVIKAIAREEKSFQEGVNRSFSSLNEGAFKGLRRQLPVTRMKVEWEKIGGYRLGQDIGGGSSR
jgi:capping protein alpha